MGKNVGFEQNRMIIPRQEVFLFRNQRTFTKPPDVIIPCLNRGASPHPLCPVAAVRRLVARTRTVDPHNALFVHTKTGVRLKAAAISH